MGSTSTTTVVREYERAKQQSVEHLMCNTTPNGADSRDWMRTVGSGLEILMRHARYSEAIKDAYLTFTAENVTPFLGPLSSQRRPRWLSFMTDDFSPVEYSWAWSPRPKIRFSFEPISMHLDMLSDPFNRQEPLRCVQQLRTALPWSDWTLFDILAKEFHSKEARILSKAAETNPQASNQSALFLALEYASETTEPMAKAYIIPVRAEQIGTSRQTILDHGVRTIGTPNLNLRLPAWSLWEEYVASRPVTSPVHILGIAIDCVEPNLSRLKIYFRTKETSFDSVRAVLTMNGAHQGWNERSLIELRELWCSVLSLDHHFSDSRELQPCTHETSGMLFNVDVKPGASDVETKLYIPVKHYGSNDRNVAQGLTRWLRSKNRGEYTAEFQSALNELCHYRKLEAGSGLQTYISVALKKGQLDISSYLSPELYHMGRLKHRDFAS